MKIRLIIILFTFFSLSLPSLAQKKELSTARDQIKSGKNLDKAEQSMEALLKDSSNRSNSKIWLTLIDAIQKQYDTGNEQLYLKQKYDTAQLFNLTKQLFLITERFDSVDAAPDEKGRIRPEYRKKHSEMLGRIRPNLYNGGLFFLKKQKYDDAYSLFNTYIDCINQPLLRSYNYTQTDSKLSSAAYWAMYCGYKLKDTKATLHHAYWALKDTTHYEYILQYLAETYKLDKDTTRYLHSLDEGFHKFKKNPYFYTRLVDYYSDNKNINKALQYSDEGLEADSTNKLIRFTKSTLLLNSGKYNECITICNSLLADNDTIADIYLNIGLAYYNMAVEMDKNVQRFRKKRDTIIDNYKNAVPYLQKYKALAPDDKSRWAIPLYTIYLNLNMGKEFDEIDKIMRNKNK